MEQWSVETWQKPVAAIDKQRLWWRFRTSSTPVSSRRIRGFPGHHWSCLQASFQRQATLIVQVDSRVFLRGTRSSLARWYYVPCGFCAFVNAETRATDLRQCRTGAEHRQAVTKQSGQENGDRCWHVPERVVRVALGTAKLRGNFEAASLKHPAGDRLLFSQFRLARAKHSRVFGASARPGTRQQSAQRRRQDQPPSGAIVCSILRGGVTIA